MQIAKKAYIVVLVVMAIGILTIGIYGVRRHSTKAVSSFDNKDLTDIVPVTDSGSEESMINVVCLGNAPFADARGLEDGMASLLEQKGDVKVYNLAASNTYASAKKKTYLEEYPFDAFSFYWLTTALAVDNTLIYDMAFETLNPVSNEMREIYSQLQSIDMNNVDAVIVMYDGSDYIAGRALSDPENPMNIQTFKGALNAGIQLLKMIYPDLQIIVVSPPYAYSPDLAGNLQDSNQYQYGDAYLYDYVISAYTVAWQNEATYLDTYYLTNEQPDYLTDYIHLSQQGRELLVDQIYAALKSSRE